MVSRPIDVVKQSVIYWQDISAEDHSCATAAMSCGELAEAVMFQRWGADAYANAADMLREVNRYRWNPAMVGRVRRPVDNSNELPSQ